MMNDEKVGFKFPIGLETAGKTIRLSDEFESIKEAIIIILSTQNHVSRFWMSFKRIYV